MDIKRIKTVMILILVVINAFFVYNIVSDHLDKNYIDDETIENAVEILSRDGIMVDKRIIPKKRVYFPIYESFFDDSQNEKVLELLSGAETERTFSVPGGMRFVSKNGDTLEFSGHFDIEFISKDTNKYVVFEDIISLAMQNEVTEYDADLIEKIGSLFDSDDLTLDGYADLGVDCIGVYEAANYRVIKFSQTIDRLPIYGHDVFCVLDGENLLYMKGLWCFLTTDEKYSSQLYDPINILFMEKKQISETRDEREEAETADLVVEKIDTVYCSYLNDAKTGVYFIPAWRITYADGTEAVYDSVNAMKYVGIK